MKNKKSKLRTLIHVIVLSLIFGTVSADEVKLSEQLDNSIMKKLLGHWQITDSTKDQQGQWQEGKGASWHFYPILNGHAVQDDWISPPLDQPEPDVNQPNGGRQFGTNIRIFNPKENRWEMAWASSKGQKVDTFTATEKDGKITMSGQFNGKPSRITFYDIKTNSFDWKLEYQKADQTWLEVYRIHGKKNK